MRCFTQQSMARPNRACKLPMLSCYIMGCIYSSQNQLNTDNITYNLGLHPSSSCNSGRARGWEQLLKRWGVFYPQSPQSLKISKLLQLPFSKRTTSATLSFNLSFVPLFFFQNKVRSFVPKSCTLQSAIRKDHTAAKPVMVQYFYWLHF